MDKKELFECIEKKSKKNRIVIMTIAGPLFVSIDDFCNQDAKGILYDLNRDEATTLTLGNEGLVRWVNDYAVAKVIRHLKDNQK